MAIVEGTQPYVRASDQICIFDLRPSTNAFNSARTFSASDAAYPRSIMVTWFRRALTLFVSRLRARA